MPPTVSIKRERDWVIIADSAPIADTMLTRLRGLLGRKSLAPGEGLVICDCQAVHTLFMQFPLDIVFCRRVDTIAAIHEAVAPWRLVKPCWEASYVIELPAGTASGLKLSSGDKLILEHNDRCG